MSSPRSPAVPFVPDDRRQVGRYLLAERLFHHERQIARARPGLDNSEPESREPYAKIRELSKEQRARDGAVPPEQGDVRGYAREKKKISMKKWFFFVCIN